MVGTTSAIRRFVKWMENLSIQDTRITLPRPDVLYPYSMSDVSPLQCARMVSFLTDKAAAR